MHKIARSYRMKLRYWYDYDDLLAMGREAVWRAHQSYDPHHGSGAKFMTYAHRCVVLGFQQIYEATRASNRVIHRYEKSVSEERPDGIPVIEYPESSLPLPDAGLDFVADRHLLTTGLFHLLPVERWILRQRFYENRTLLECAQVRGVSRERIRQIEFRALKKLRQHWEREKKRLGKRPLPQKVARRRGLCVP